MNKKKVLKIFLFIILVLLIIFLTIVIRRMLIIKDLSEKVAKYITDDNHYEKIINNSIETETITEYYCRGDNAVMFLTTTTKNTGEKRKLTQYFKGEKCNTYIETDKDKIAMMNSNGIPSKLTIWGLDYNHSLWNLFYLALKTPIKSVKYDNKECYFLNSPIARNCYMEKNTGLILKAIDGQIEDANGNKTDVIVEYNYEFGNVDENIFIEPNISDYKIQKNN